MNNYIVYIHTNKNNGKKYVGITCQNPARRWRNGNGYYQNQHFYRAIRRDGWDGFDHEIICEGLTKAEATKRERELVALFRSNEEEFGYNKSVGGENPAEGCKHSEATRQRMSEAHKGIVFSDERKANMRKAARKRGNMKSGKFGAACMKSGIVRQIDPITLETIAEYYGFCEMQRMTGFALSPVKRAAKGKQRQSYGYFWEYIPRRMKDVSI